MAEVNPSELNQLNRYLWMSRVLISALDLDVFSIVGKNGASAEEVSSKSKASLRGVKSLLDALTPMGLLERGPDDKYKLTEFGASAFTSGSADYLGGRIMHMERLWESWGDLTETIRSGEPVWKRKDAKRDPNALVHLAEGLFPQNYAIALKAADALGAGKSHEGIDVLDIGAGSGAWSLAFLTKDSTSKAVAVDFPPVLDMAKKKAETLGVADRFKTKPGNLREVDFGNEAFDLVILGHICHSEGAEWSEKLIQRSARALRKGGRILIAEMIPDDDRRGPLFPLLFSLNMMLNTEQGDVFSLAEYQQWLSKAGFGSAKTIKIENDFHSPLIVAEKA